MTNRGSRALQGQVDVCRWWYCLVVGNLQLEMAGVEAA